MNSWNQIVSFTQVRQLGRLLKPGCLEQGVESIFPAPVNDSGAYNKDFHIFPFEGQNFILDLLDKLVFGERHSGLVIAVLPKRVLDWLLLHCIIFVIELLSPLAAFVLLSLSV